MYELQTGTVGGVTHALKGNWLYELPFGREKRFASGAGPVLDAIIGGWEFDGVARIQTGEMLDFGNVRLVGMTKEEFQKSFNLRVAANGQLYLLPQDIIDNTVKAFNTLATSSTGYGAAGPPSGRYLAPANGPDCIETAPGFGDCGIRSLVVTGPKLIRFDLSAVKRVKIHGNVTFEFRGEFLNAFNRPYFAPVTGFTTTSTNPNGPGIATPITNATTTNENNFRIIDLLGDNTSRIIQLVWRIRW